MKDMKKVVLALLAVVVAAGLAACGSSDTTSEDESDAVSGPFELVSDAPSGYKSLAGEATVERADGGTTVSLRVTGLKPRTAYVAHLHSGSCDQTDPGGPHFKFNAKGSDEPPNEIHLEFSSKADGAASVTASSSREVPAGEAGSVVIHETESDQKTAGAASAGEALFVHGGEHHEEPTGPEKIACAELEGGGGGSGSGSQVSGGAESPPWSSATANPSAESRSSSTAPATKSASGSSRTSPTRSTSTATT